MVGIFLNGNMPEDPANMPWDHFGSKFFPQIGSRELAAKAPRKNSQNTL